jgi:DMSO/TMAO reductase YedYZ molybdopterin-dependent catalytic subunit
MIEGNDIQGFSQEEVGLAFRNHGMHLEGLRYPATPIGMHYLLIHFDIPVIEASRYELEIAGRVRNPMTLSLDDLKSRPAVSTTVVMECAGNGRSRLSPRPASAPWGEEAIGCSEWTGTPLAPILEEAGLLDAAVEILFSGSDRGIDDGVEHAFERSLPEQGALREDLLLAYEMNGLPLPPQHGFPLRLVVPDHYGVASVKWLLSITALEEPFEGVQQTVEYLYQTSEEDPGVPVGRKLPRALMVPPGIPDFLSRERHLGLGCVTIEGKAWSGYGKVEQVEFSSDGDERWRRVRLGDAEGPHAWAPWSYGWEAREPGAYELCVRATDETGRTQPLEADGSWNVGGIA